MTAPPVNTKAARPAAPRFSRWVAKDIAALAKACGAMDPELAANWDEIAGADLAAICRPIRLKKQGRTHTLVVAVNSGAAATKVQFMQPQLLQRASAWLKLPALKKLVIEQAGSITRSEPAGRARWASRRYTADTLPTREATAEPPARNLDEALRRLKRSLSEGKLNK